MQSKKKPSKRRHPWLVQGLALVLVGVLMLCGALFFLLRNQEEDARAGQASQDAMVMLESIIATAEPVEDPDADVSLVEVPEGAPSQETASPEALPLPRKDINGNIYVGYLVIPSLDRKLPVMELSYLEQLQIAPCLQAGSPHENNAVICAHNYPSHFGPLRDFEGGEEIRFVDLNGVEIAYQVALVKTISPNDAQEVLDSPHDLVLYTCTQGGQNRVMIACDRAA